MGIVIRKRKKIGQHSYLNISGSGVSISLKQGPITINSKGGITLRLGNGIAYRTSVSRVAKRK